MTRQLVNYFDLGQGCTYESMFSRLLNSSVAFFFPYNALSESASSSQVDQQIQTELDQAAEQGMVSTRSQDSTPTGDASRPSKLLYPQVIVHEKRRKAGNEGPESPAPAVTKRRRRSTKPNRETPSSSGVRKPGRPRKSVSKEFPNGNEGHAIDQNEPGQEPSTQGSGATSRQTARNTTEQAINDDEKYKAIEVAVNKPNSNDEVSETHIRAKPHSGSPTRSRQGEIQKKRRKKSNGITGVDGDGADTKISGKKLEVPPATAAKATHKRFGSEDIEEPGTVPSNGVEGREGGREDLSEDEDNSGDEAPEILTALAGFDKARASALDAAKVAARQEADKKLRRREHNKKLGLQAKTAKDSRSKDKPSSKVRRTAQTSAEKSQSSDETPQTINDRDPIPHAEPKYSSRKPPLPHLLPQEILAATPPTVHAPTPPLPKSKLAVSQKQKFLDLEPKPPKDVKRGNVTIRVLHENESILPPKSTQTSKALRESWLAGRRGFKGEKAVPRRKPGGGFVRQK